MVKNGNWEFFSSFYFCKNRNQNGNLFQAIFETHQVTNNSQGCHKRGGWGAPLQFLAKQLTLYQPGGQIMPTIVVCAPHQIFRPSEIQKFVKRTKSSISTVKISFEVGTLVGLIMLKKKQNNKLLLSFAQASKTHI